MRAVAPLPLQGHCYFEITLKRYGRADGQVWCLQESEMRGERNDVPQKKSLVIKNSSSYCLFTDELALIRRIYPPFCFVNVMTDSVMDIVTVTFFADLFRHILCKGVCQNFLCPASLTPSSPVQPLNGFYFVGVCTGEVDIWDGTWWEDHRASWCVCVSVCLCVCACCVCLCLSLCVCVHAFIFSCFV